MSNKYKSVDYALDLRETFFPWCRREMICQPWIWQQDNSCVHTSHLVSKCSDEENVLTSDWPPRSPDLSPIENVWKLLQEKVYENGQFDDKCNLIKIVKHCANHIDPNIIKKLYNTMPRRLLAVIDKKGGEI